ncbi:hypothetical protein GDO81_017413 [Engystomops pustulosus]|uniref:Uncharacterized protein n=1 Tax=Engystomops pustulosus TaxID=76066 RepID=A0AAV7AHZ2_ENGPU|nr:hypothetical protein GDO81_017413 [Engystomops pustulosus]
MAVTCSTFLQRQQDRRPLVSDSLFHAGFVIPDNQEDREEMGQGDSNAPVLLFVGGEDMLNIGRRERRPRRPRLNSEDFQRVWQEVEAEMFPAAPDPQTSSGKRKRGDGGETSGKKRQKKAKRRRRRRN